MWNRHRGNVMGAVGEMLEPRRLLAAHVWTGAVSDAWSDAGNWVGGVPQAGEEALSLEFPAGPQRVIARNDIASLVIHELKFGSAAYTLSGTTFTLSGELQGGAANARINADVSFSGEVQLDFNSEYDAPTHLTFSSEISGDGTVRLSGRGYVHFNGNNTSTGSVTVENGYLIVDGQHGSPIRVDFSGTLAGRGTVGKVNVAGHLGNDIEINRGNGNEIDPNATYYGVPDATSDLDLSGGYFSMYFADDSAMTVAGSVNLTNASFLAISNAVPTPGQTIVLIANDGNDPIIGTFAGVTEGSLVEIYGNGYRLSYQGGDGNDLVLQAVAEPITTRTVLVSNPQFLAAAGQSVKLTASVTPDGGSPSLAGGVVQFYSGTDLLGTATTGPAGHAVFTTTQLGIKAHELRAVFVGNAQTGLVGSTSNSVNLRVVQTGSTTMSFVVSPSSGSVGDPGTLLVKVAGQGLPAGVPTGTVSFYMSGTLLKTVTLDAGGNASHLVSNFPIGNVDIEAVYSGDSKFGQNRATASHFTRMPAGNSYPTRTTLTVSKTAATDSEPVRLTARVTRTAGDYNEPFAGPVLFKVGTRVVGRAQVNAEGVASVDVILPVGLDVVVAAYGGGNTYQESTSAGVTVNVTSSTSQPTETWTVAANVDANNDGILDAVIRKNETGDTAIRILDANGNVVRVETLPRTADPNWLLDTAVDVNNDQSVDLFWRNQNTGATLIWQLNSGKFVKVATLGAPRVAAGWRAVGGGDFNRDGFNDVVWFNDTTNKTSIWTMRGLNVRSLTMINSTPRADGWGLSAVRDVNDDGRPDLVWHNRITNTDFAWLMDNSTVVGSQKV